MNNYIIPRIETYPRGHIDGNVEDKEPNCIKKKANDSPI